MTLAGVAHLALDIETDTAELGLSVLPECRGKGYGDGLLTDYAREAMHDQVALVDYLFKQQTRWLTRKRG